ncbi:MAG: SUMF1/EgtB/PvdO family nonheme iron enzyme [Actinomycetota bacterium]
MRSIRSHLTYSNVISTLCLFLLLSGGTAVALTGSNTVQSDDLGPGAQVRAPDVAANAVDSPDVTNNSLTGADVNEASLDATPLRTRVAQGGCAPAVAGTGAMVKVGSFCIDRYEASVWSSPTGGTQYGVNSDNYPCHNNGQNCTNIYARSVAGTPSRFITWFQAQQALANSGKRLPTNAEWQMAVAGTPGSTACNVSTGSAANTGANAACASNHGANDMVGNLWEWVADWDEEASTTCANWPAGFGNDFTCLGGGSSRFPSALIRGGDFDDGTEAGPFAVWGRERPSSSFDNLGFRGAR